MYKIKKLEWKLTKAHYHQYYSQDPPYFHIYSEDAITWYAEEPMTMNTEPLFSGTLDECKEFLQNYFEDMIKKFLEPV